MAFRSKKFVFGVCTTVFRTRLQPGQGQVIAATYVHIPVANLSSTGGQKKVRPPAWPYEKKRYTAFSQFYDHTTKRFDENTKIIVVDGNMGVDRASFAQQIAREFDLHYLPDIDPNKNFIVGEGFDIRMLSEQLPVGARLCDLQTFYEHKAPKVQLMKIGMTQRQLYEMRFFNYARALEHVLNTGQGVVMDHSVWSDIVFADALRKHNYITANGYKYYEDVRRNTICELWKPHLVVYLHAPVTFCREQISKRPEAWLSKSPVLTEEFLKSVEQVYREKLLPYLSTYSEVLEYEVQDMPEWDIVVEDLERLELDKAPEGKEEKFEDWQLRREDDWNHYRGLMGAKWQLRNLFMIPDFPWDAPELLVSGNDLQALQQVLFEGASRVQVRARLEPRESAEPLQAGLDLPSKLGIQHRCSDKPCMEHRFLSGICIQHRCSDKHLHGMQVF